jgi:hypothetical protein
VSDGIYGWCRSLAVIDTAVAIYLAGTGQVDAAVGIMALAAIIYGLGLWSRWTHRRYGEDDPRTSWSALFRRGRRFE